MLVRRDNREKTIVSLDEIEIKVQGMLDIIHNSMLEEAKKTRDEKTYVATNMEEFEDTIENKPGFIKAMWCGDKACEDKIREVTGATSRCMPFEQEVVSDTCVCCGKKAKNLVYWGRAY